MVVRFRDHVDIETILSKAYKFKYLKEISVARAKLYILKKARDAWANRQTVQLRYPARLLVFFDDKCMSDVLPDWFKDMGGDRLQEKTWQGRSEPIRVYLEITVANNVR